jgi:hypothetical protein
LVAGEDSSLRPERHLPGIPAADPMTIPYAYSIHYCNLNDCFCKEKKLIFYKKGRKCGWMALKNGQGQRRLTAVGSFHQESLRCQKKRNKATHVGVKARIIW